MFARALLTAASLLVALAGIQLLDCDLGFVDSDPLGMCATTVSLGVATTPVGVGLLVFAVLALIGVWVPAARPGAKRRRMQPNVSLVRNIDRIAEVGTDLVEPDIPDACDRLVMRLEALEASLESGSDASREQTELWMRLLREANDLHNDGDLVGDEFKRINTRLLDLFIEPVKASPRLA